MQNLFLDILDLVLWNLVETCPDILNECKGVRGTCHRAKTIFDHYIKTLWIDAGLLHSPSFGTDVDIQRLHLCIHPDDRDGALAESFLFATARSLVHLDIDVGSVAESFGFPESLRRTLCTLTIRSHEAYGMIELLCDPSLPWLALETLHLHGHILFSPTGLEIFRSSGYLFPKLSHMELSPTTWCSILIPHLEKIQHIRITGFHAVETMYVDVTFESPLPASCVVEWDIVRGHGFLQVSSLSPIPRVVLHVPSQTFTSANYDNYQFHLLNSTQKLRRMKTLRHVDIISPGASCDDILPLLESVFDSANIRCFVS